jgi:hypothetical protein
MRDGVMAEETARPNAEDSVRAGIDHALQEMIAFSQKLIERCGPSPRVKPSR